jgi:hypothetical protein
MYYYVYYWVGKTRITWKEKIMVDVGDVVEIFFREQPTFFARIDSIAPDSKKDWYMVELLILTMPLRQVTWTLREEYINGVPFTMEGNEVRIEAVNPLPTGGNSEDSEKTAIGKHPSKNARKILPFKKPTKGPKKGA